MSTASLVQPHHLARRAAIYIRQSTGHQVMTNLESQKLQTAMREHARHLGWKEEHIDVVDGDMGRSGASTAGRDAYRDLLSDVALGQIGIVLSYDSARLSRNCSDWYPLLDVCALKGCLVADRDGVYDPASVNGRLLLGMKGILSEVELHTMRGRLTAGLRNKARRGELAMPLPVGFVRDCADRIVKDPDTQVQEAIMLVFDSFLEHRSAHKVAAKLRAAGLHVPSRWHSEETIWVPPNVPKVLRILRNPLFAGVYTYGRKRWKPEVEADGKRKPRYRSLEECQVALFDHHPAYVSWETFQRIQAILADNYAEYARRMSQGSTRNGAALLQGIAYCGECGRKLQVTYKSSVRYQCRARRATEEGPVCQSFCGDTVDRAVAETFFQALAPAELDVYEQAVAARRKADAAVDKAQEMELQRLRYEADLARRRYDKSDPDNRLVTAELERRWEVALQGLQDAQSRFEELRAERDRVVPFAIPQELRTAFTNLGSTLPQAWSGGILTNSQRKALLRCLIDKVVMRREGDHPDHVAVRIVWRGGAVSERTVRVQVRHMEDLSDFAEIEAAVLALARDGRSDQEVATILTERGYRSAKQDRVVPGMVLAIRRHHRVMHMSRLPDPGNGWLTVRELATAIGAGRSWIYSSIERGRIAIVRDEVTGLFLFPNTPETIEALVRLRKREVSHVVVDSSDPHEGHRDG